MLSTTAKAPSAMSAPLTADFHESVAGANLNRHILIPVTTSQAFFAARGEQHGEARLPLSRCHCRARAPQAEWSRIEPALERRWEDVWRRARTAELHIARAHGAWPAERPASTTRWGLHDFGTSALRGNAGPMLDLEWSDGDD